MSTPAEVPSPPGARRASPDRHVILAKPPSAGQRMITSGPSLHRRHIAKGNGSREEVHGDTTSLDRHDHSEDRNAMTWMPSERLRACCLIPIPAIVLSTDWLDDFTSNHQDYPAPSRTCLGARASKPPASKGRAGSPKQLSMQVSSRACELKPQDRHE